jgi:hypothetical protein
MYEAVPATSHPAAAVARPVEGWSARGRSVAIEAGCFVLVAAVYLAHLIASGYDRFYYDADEYWRLGDQLSSGGHFSLLSYAYDWRGYSMPLVTHTLDAVGSMAGAGDVTIVRIFGACLAATLGVVVAPRLAKTLFPGAAITPTRVLALNGLLFLYWRDHFGFPLVDFPALLCAAVGVLALLQRRWWGYLAAGACLGFAANLRPNYGFALAAAFAVAALVPLRQWKLPARAAAVALVAAGAFAAFAPQIAINQHQRGSWSPFTAKAHEQTLVSIWVGLTAQKYETYVGPAAEYPEPGVSYLDPATARLLEKEGIKPVVSASNHLLFPSTGEYLSLVANHPVEMSASYARHVFNGLDVRYPTPYVRDLRDTSIALSVLQYTLIFLALVSLLLPGARKALGEIRWSGLVVLVAGCIGVLQVQAEPRYFLPLTLPIYLLVCFGPAARMVFTRRDRRITLAVAYAVCLLVCLTLSSNTQAELEHPLGSTAAAAR